ncbi:hypothetical protein RHGRI_007047 [Rhododendron griersonianum]|uniref:Uncharacterized protein n=1 Tax=Rhododendron griersonianum TaxID=479676 RepID=A0AAV6KW57_9ERIC|nr:hypothetical protein RHGRI_007047 [Rhododendron griersonianum]
MAGEESGPSLAELALNFFNYALQRPKEVIFKYANTPGRHLLDILRSSFIPTDQEEIIHGYLPPNHVIQCTSKLRQAGIDLKRKPGNEDSFLVVKFRHGVIEMPTVLIDDFMSCFMVNCIAFEQCQLNCTKHFTTYATLLDCLVDTGIDVEFLLDRKIVENYFGSDTELAKFINVLGKDVTIDIDKCYLGDLFDEVKYYKSGWHAQWASYRYTYIRRYFRSPWSFIAALAAFVLLLLTVAQTFYTILAYIRPHN